ncbi:MAG: hypothetical protein F2942_00695 [Actinobacteria bacterium]|uniref:Unannotated protein n=1 Tax=freshwater metagenome TaxID=449393 RepID=A0A6J7SLX8_9ZZZZ|nr:hypothetical protein [Actinomycetota bacterium]MTA73205.1 hypothetical protein [Actinomycetota bacterium]
MRTRSAVSVGAFLVWTIFVWGIVRVRNIMGDAELTSSERTWPLILAASLWVPAVVLLIVLVVTVIRKKPFGQAATVGVAVLGVWTTLVWMVRAFDIALVSDRELPFILVHLVLAVISVGLAVLAALALRPDPALTPNLP